jgi:hypothetical protein
MQNEVYLLTDFYCGLSSNMQNETLCFWQPKNVWHETICIHQVSITICKITLILTIRQIGNQNHKYIRGLIRTSNLLVLKTVTTSLLNFVPGLLLFRPVA